LIDRRLSLRSRLCAAPLLLDDGCFVERALNRAPSLTANIGD
jgi:hypothetical protein